MYACVSVKERVWETYRITKLFLGSEREKIEQSHIIFSLCFQSYTDFFYTWSVFAVGTWHSMLLLVQTFNMVIYFGFQGNKKKCLLNSSKMLEINFFFSLSHFLKNWKGEKGFLLEQEGGILLSYGCCCSCCCCCCCCCCCWDEKVKPIKVIKIETTT